MDSIVKVLLQDYRTACGASFLFHHIISIYGLPSMFNYTYSAWYLIGPPALHSFLMVFPQIKFLNYIYLISVICFHYGLYVEPYASMKSIRHTRLGITLIEISCVLLWFFNCSNALETDLGV